MDTEQGHHRCRPNFITGLMSGNTEIKLPQRNNSLTDLSRTGHMKGRVSLTSFSLVLTTFSVAQTTLTYCRMNCKLTRVQKENVVVSFKVLSQYLCEGIDSSHEKSLIQKTRSVGKIDI
jgi:hypothetical protein